MEMIHDKYELNHCIGTGGMAEVYAGRRIGAEGFAKRVAIKRILQAASLDPLFQQQFVREAKLVAKLQHKNIVSILDFDRDYEEHYFLAMELIDGVNLHQLLQTGPLPNPLCLHIVCQVLQGLQYAHGHTENGKPCPIIHRDISTHNIMISWEGEVKIVDFGLAKAILGTNLSRPGSLRGKVSYMSPEQAKGHHVDERSDLFSVGVILYELLTGYRPFTGDSDAEILSKLVTQPAPDILTKTRTVSTELAACIERFLQKAPDHRWANASKAYSALKEHAQNNQEPVLRELVNRRFHRQTTVALSQDALHSAQTIIDPTIQKALQKDILQSGSTPTSQQMATSSPYTHSSWIIVGLALLVSLVIVSMTWMVLGR